MIKTPNPGSPDAVKAGCTCPIMDNHHGAGIAMPNGRGGLDTLFWKSGDCPLHAIQEGPVLAVIQVPKED